MILLLAASILSFTLSLSTKQVIMRKLLKDNPKVIFKVWHLIFKKNYSLDSSLAIQKYKAFSENLKYIKEVNSKSLEFTPGLEIWAD
jgi:hypothetical protein